MVTAPVVGAAGAFRRSKGACITQDLDSLLRGKDLLLRADTFPLEELFFNCTAQEA